MAMPVQLSQGEARTEVLLRLGFAQQGTAVLRNVNLVDAWIRQAMNQLAPEADWSDLYKELQIPLIDGQDTYEFPDETDIGSVDTVWITDTSGRMYQTQGGTQWQDFGGEGGQDEQYRIRTGRPQKWQILNREIRLYPAPLVATYPTLTMRYISRLPRLMEDGELLPFDSELIVQQAVVLGKRHYKHADIGQAMGDLARYLDRVKTKQRAPRTFTIGGRKSHFVTRPKEPNTIVSDSVGPDATFTDGWTPW
jgi:hypothetical protein